MESNHRFVGFSAPYIEIRLRDVCEVITKGTTPSYFCDGGVSFVKIDSLEDNRIKKEKLAYVDEKTHFGFLKRSILKENDVLLAIAGATVGKHAIVTSDILPANTNQALAIIRIKKQLIPEYLLSFFDSSYLDEYIKLICAASAQPNLNLVQVGDIKLSIPSDLEEQRKICDFFVKIDNRIIIQRKIINYYEALKKTYVDRIFFNDRNKEFVSLNEVLIERKSKAPKDGGYIHATLSKDGISQKTERYDRDFLVKDENKEYKITKLGDIVYNPANLKFGVICMNNFGDAIISPIYVTYEVSKKFNREIVEAFVTSPRFIWEIRKYEEGTVYERMAVSSDDFLKGKMPVLDDETVLKVTHNLRILNKKIKLEKDILAKFEEQKKGLLKEMM